MNYSIKFSFNLVAILVFSIGLFSCDKEEQEIFVPNNTQESELMTSKSLQAIDNVTLEIIKNALASRTQGMAAEAIKAAVIANNEGQELACGDSAEMNYENNYSDEYMTADYYSTLNWEQACYPNQMFKPLNYDRDTYGTYTTNLFVSEDNAQCNLKINGITEDDSFYEVSGLYTREGVLTLEESDGGAYTSTINILINDIMVDKETLKINSGSASFTLTGNTDTGVPFVLTGSATLNGDDTLTITLFGFSHTFEL